MVSIPLLVHSSPDRVALFPSCRPVFFEEERPEKLTLEKERKEMRLRLVYSSYSF